jgi:hypothetical protein
MAEDLPLVLNSCQFDNLQMKTQPSVLWSLTAHFETVWEKHMLAAARAENALQFLQSQKVRIRDWVEFRQSLLDKYVDSSPKQLCAPAATSDRKPSYAFKRAFDQSARNDIIVPDHKRCKVDLDEDVTPAEMDSTTGSRRNDVLVWKVALLEMMEGYRLHPLVGATKYLPLKQVNGDFL